MDAAAIARILQDYGVEASPALCNSIRLYTELLLKWNQKVSLTSITSPGEIIGRHFGESLFAVHAIPLPPRSFLVDVGSGAGFPGLALKLMLPETYVNLIEANTKKAAFLNEAVRHLRLEDVTVWRMRTAEMDPSTLLARYVTARAVGRFDELLEWARKALAKNGRLVLWLGADDAASLARGTRRWSWSRPAPIPKSQRRVLLVGTPQ